MAHGYAKVARKPMAAMIGGIIGLQHASMAIYNAYADRVPMLVLSGNIPNGAARRPNVEWNHSALDQNAMVRDFTKWDAQPTSLQSTAEALVQAYDLATIAPMGPVLVTLDADLQEEGLPREEEAHLRIPKLRPRAHPQADADGVRDIARMLVAAENPVIYANRYGRTEKAPALLVQLAELLNAPVVDGRSRMNFPSRHKFNHSSRREQAFAQADVILALEPLDLWGLTNEVRDLIGRPNAQLNRQANLKIAHIGTENLMVKANYAEVQRYAAADISLPGDAEATMPALIEAVKRELTPARTAALAARGQRLAEMAPRLLDQARADAVHGWDASPISVPRMVMELYENLRGVDWTMPTETVFLSDWPHRLWNIDKPHNWIGGSGAQGVGYNAPAALGAALANKSTGPHHGRHRRRRRDDDDQPDAVDGGALQDPDPLSRAQQPRLSHGDHAHGPHGRPPQPRHAAHPHGLRYLQSRTSITPRWRNRWASTARGRSPIRRISGAAIKRAMDVVKRGEPALIDVVSQPR